MLNRRLNAARNVHADLIPAEQAADAFFMNLLKLGHTMCAARVEANLPIHTGQAEFDDITAAIALAGQARSRVINAHRAMSGTMAEILPGVPTKAVGDNGECPPGSASLDTEDTGALRVVA